ncbi:Lrp/AsnC family transcriptional regulator [Streptomyces virginiae]|uniref:Lrp/AsnC family transcriptional regulator n=1 Tax=Streptomyces virginiae TaxID=1961 RepID=UPI003321DA40
MERYTVRRDDLLWEDERGPWAIKVTCNLNAPFDGPTEVRVWFTADPDDPGPEVDAAMATDGIPTTLLRAIPLVEIRGKARACRKHRAEAPEVPHEPVPKRMATERDYALLAAELFRVRSMGGRAPQAALAKRQGIAKATLSERIKRARDLGLWDGKALTSTAVALILTGKASSAELDNNE